MLVIVCSCLTACDSYKSKVKKNLEQMQSVPITITYEDFTCWTSDSIKKIAPWKFARLKLVHYIDSVQCSSCYLTKLIILDPFLALEKESKNKFYNVFIVEPGTKVKNWRLLTYNYEQKLTPPTLFIDTAHCFLDKNVNIPKDNMYHIFLLDEDNNVIFVGNPHNNNIRQKMIDVIKKNISNYK